MIFFVIVKILKLYVPYCHSISILFAFQGDEPMFTCHSDDRMDADYQPLSTITDPELVLRSPVRSSDTSCKQKRTGASLAFKYELLSCAKVWLMTLDYFWYSSNKIECTDVLEMHDESVLESFHSCPNEVFPSDHLLMMAKFKFIS